MAEGKLAAGLVGLVACGISSASVTATLLLTTDVTALIAVQIAAPVVLAMLYQV